MQGTTCSLFVLTVFGIVLHMVGGALVENPRAPHGFVPKDRSGYQLLNARRALERAGGGMRETTQPPPEPRSDTVPFVVGGVLAGLIVVVLVSYFVVRLRKGNSMAEN